jgi:transcriptional regulator with XRE-family HTH domain
MKPDDPRAERWRQLLADELTQTGMSQSDLGRAIGRTAAQVNQWVNPGNRYGPPEPDVVFAIEDALGCPDRLSSALGYIRPGSVPDVEQAVRVDPNLTKAQRETLLDLWQVLVERAG